MPADTPFTKITNTQHLGAHVVLHGADYGECRAESERLAHESGATIVPAFDDPLVIAGQGTIALEILAQAPDIDTIVVPVGGGGLVAGIALATKARRPDVAVIGVQVEGYEGMLHALGRHAAPADGPTIAEGIAVAHPGTITRAIVEELVDDIVVVSEQRIEEAIALGIEIEKTVIEGAGGAGLAAVLAPDAGVPGERAAVVLTGGNIDARVLSSVLLRALARSGRIVRLRIDVPDRPGVLATVAEVVGSLRGNIVDVAHRRDQPGVAVKRTMLELSVETRDRAHADEIVKALTTAGFRVDVD
jgi:threonine dehydratase